VFLFTESTSRPDETRLRKHLFDPEYQAEDLLTFPLSGPYDIINVTMTMHFVKLIGLVKTMVLYRPTVRQLAHFFTQVDGC